MPLVADFMDLDAIIGRFYGLECYYWPILWTWMLLLADFMDLDAISSQFYGLGCY